MVSNRAKRHIIIRGQFVIDHRYLLLLIIDKLIDNFVDDFVINNLKIF